MADDNFGLGPEFLPVNLVDLKKELERELSMRREVFPRWVQQRKLSPHNARWRVLCLKKAIELLGELDAKGAIHAPRAVECTGPHDFDHYGVCRICGKHVPTHD